MSSTVGPAAPDSAPHAKSGQAARKKGHVKREAKRGGEGGKQASDLPVEGTGPTPELRRDALREAGRARATEEGGPGLDVRTFKVLIRPIIEEYFVSGDLAELAEAVEELDAAQYGSDLVKRAIRLSLDHTDRERALVSHLLSSAPPPHITPAQIKAAFDSLLAESADLKLDCPQSDQQLASFLARAVIDDVLPPSYVSDRIAAQDAPGAHILQQAVVLLSVKRCGAVLEHIWAIGPDAPLDDLESSVTLLVKEYLSSLDVAEALVCVKELNVPHFHHEIVRRGCEIAMDKGREACEALSALLTFLFYQHAISRKQVFMGFQRVLAALPDLKLDIPDVGRLFSGLVQRAEADGLLSAHQLDRIRGQWE